MHSLYELSDSGLWHRYTRMRRRRSFAEALRLPQTSINTNHAMTLLRHEEEIEALRARLDAMEGYPDGERVTLAGGAA